jgi:GTPase
MVNLPANDAVLLGPDSVGQFMPTAVKTIQRKRASVNSGEAGQSVS